MTRIVIEGSVFTLVAVAAHLAFWVPEGAEEGLEGSGAGGEQILSIKPASSSVANMVKAWETPPEVSEAVEPKRAVPEPAMSPTVEMPRPSAPAPLAARRAGAELRMTPGADVPALPSYEEPQPAKRELAPAPKVRPKLKPPELAQRKVTSTQKPAEKTTVKKTPSEKASDPAQKSASKASQGAQKRVAKGAGQGVAKGKNKAAQSATLSREQRTSLLRSWGTQIRARIARRAPRGEGRGTAVVTITVSGSGALLGVSLAKSSGNPRIDKLALASVRQAGRFPAAPGKLGVGQHAFRLPIRSR